jgi:hypothetical protein
MNYIAIGFIALISLLLFYTGLRLTNAIHGNFQRASELRNQYAQRIRLLPMYKILCLRGIDLNQLLYQSPVAEIETSIRNCENCNISEACQTVLKEKTNQDFSHCANDYQVPENTRAA